MNLNVNQINSGLIKEENFTTALCKNNYILMSTRHNKGKSIVKWQLMIVNLILVISIS